MTGPPCAVTGCNRPHHARGFCRCHYRRWQRHGHPRADVPLAALVPDGGSYWSARRRVLALRGPAAALRCAECGGGAAVWSYDRADPDERREPGRARPFSLDTDRYRPRCRPCTRRKARGGSRAAVLAAPDVERAARLYRAGATARGIAALLGVPRAAVLRALRAHAVPLRPSGRRR